MDVIGLKEALRVFQGQAEPREVVRHIRLHKLTGSLTLHFNSGGMCRQLEWRQKVTNPGDARTALPQVPDQVA